MTKIAVVGAGLIGRAWAITFARAGFEVALTDARPEAIEAALGYIREVLPVLAEYDLLRGSAPIVMQREIDGFVMNRMQGALLEEAFRLVADGYATAEDVDVGIREGLALRWSFMGHFETIDLNAPGGVRDYVERYQGIYERIQPSQTRRVDWAGAVLAEVERDRRARLPAEGLGERQKWRDRRLMALAAHKRRAAEDIGE